MRLKKKKSLNHGPYWILTGNVVTEINKGE